MSNLVDWCLDEPPQLNVPMSRLYSKTDSGSCDLSFELTL